MWTYRALPATCRLVTNSHLLKYSKTLNEEKKKIWPCREWHCPPVTNRCTYVSPGNTQMWHLSWLEPSWITSRTFRTLEQCCFSVLWRLLDSTSTSQLSLWLLLFLIRWQAVACMVVVLSHLRQPSMGFHNRGASQGVGACFWALPWSRKAGACLLARAWNIED